MTGAEIKHKWEKRDGPLPIGTIHYKTDFILDRVYQNRRIIVEPHGARYWDLGFLNKMKRFMNSEFSKMYHLIIIVDDIKEAKRWLARNGANQSHICHELWGEVQLRDKHFRPKGFLKSKKSRAHRRRSYEMIPKIIDSDGRAITDYGYETQKAIEFEFTSLKSRSLPWIDPVKRPVADNNFFTLRRPD